MKKHAILIIILFAQLVVCGQKSSCSVKVEEATSKSWVAGAGGRTGTAYRIKLKLKTNAPINFSGCWIGEKSVPITLEYNSFPPPAKTEKGDIICVTTNVINNIEEADFTPQKLPFNYKGVALLQLTIAGKQHYLYIKEFKVLARQAGE